MNDKDHISINRRKFLKYVVAGGASVVAVAVAVPLVTDFLSPTWQKTQNAAYPITRTDAIPVGTPTFVRFEERVPDAWIVSTESLGLWIVTKDGKNYNVFDPHCTHLKCPFYWDDQAGIFVCPCHGGRFDIDGKVLAGPPPRPLDRWEYIISAGQIEVTGTILRG